MLIVIIQQIVLGAVFSCFLAVKFANSFRIVKGLPLPVDFFNHNL